MKHLQLWQKTLLAALLGIVVGTALGEKAFYFKYIGDIFINLIKMVVVPLIFFSILNGITNLNDTTTFNRIGTKALSYYLLTTLFAVIVGLMFANIFEPGIGVNLSLEMPSRHKPGNGLLDLLMNIVPTNPIDAMAKGNTIQIVLFAFFCGFALIKIDSHGREIKDLVSAANHLVFKMIEMIINLTPYGVFAILAYVIGMHGLDVILSLSKFCAVIAGALFVQYLLFGIMILAFAKLNPIPFYRKMLPTQMLAFATVSSKATLGTAIKVMRDKMGVSKQSTSFILPLGAAMNMDGTAIYLGISCVFFAQLTGTTLNLNDYITIIFTATIGSIGAAGFPGGSVMMMSLVLSSVGLPVEGISLILGVDRFLDMLRTVVNITGDCTITLIVDKLENTLDVEKYNNHD